jgi:hypothetical protein
MPGPAALRTPGAFDAVADTGARDHLPGEDRAGLTPSGEPVIA